MNWEVGEGWARFGRVSSDFECWFRLEKQVNLIPCTFFAVAKRHRRKTVYHFPFRLVIGHFLVFLDFLASHQVALFLVYNRQSEI